LNSLFIEVRLIVTTAVICSWWNYTFKA